MQYLNPLRHSEILDWIVEADRKNMLRKTTDALALSLRVDGFVDSRQIDKIYILCKVINLDASMDLIFIGIGNQTEPGATRMLKAIITAMKESLGDEIFEIFVRKLFSICTDGAKVNTGERGGLWKKKTCKDAGSEIHLMTVWCSFGSTSGNRSPKLRKCFQFYHPFHHS